MSEQIGQDDRGLIQAAGMVMRDPAFRRELDALSVQVLDVVEEFGLAHMEELQPVLGPDGRASEVISLLVGWILGFPGARATDDKRQEMVMRHVILASFAAGLSSNLCAHQARKTLV